MAQPSIQDLPRHAADPDVLHGDIDPLLAAFLVARGSVKAAIIDTPKLREEAKKLAATLTPYHFKLHSQFESVVFENQPDAQSLEEVFAQEAREMGIDPDEIIKLTPGFAFEEMRQQLKILAQTPPAVPRLSSMLIKPENGGLTPTLPQFHLERGVALKIYRSFLGGQFQWFAGPMSAETYLELKGNPEKYSDQIQKLPHGARIIFRTSPAHRSPDDVMSAGQYALYTEIAV